MQLDLTYHHLTYHIVPGPQSLSYLIPPILLPTALLIPRTILSRWQIISIFMPAISLATIHAWQAMGCVDVISVNAVLWSLYLLVLKDPWKDFSYVKYSGSRSEAGQANGTISHKQGFNKVKTTIEETGYPSSLSARLPWVGRLLTSIRLNNWKLNQLSHDKHQPPSSGFHSRRHFLLQTLISTFRGYLILDLTSAYTTYDPYFTDPTVSINANLQLPFDSYSLPSQLIRTTIIGLQVWAMISQMFYLPFLIPVILNGLGLVPDEYSPHNWPPYFGPASSIFEHGVRGFWGTYWHQTMRHSCSGPGYAVADILGLRKRGLVRYTVINFVAFGLSGIVHMGLVPPEPLFTIVGGNVLRGYIGLFFWMQPVAMLFEIIVTRMLRAVGVHRITADEKSRALRWTVTGLWVAFWLTQCLPLLGEAGRQLGHWRFWLVPFSAWKAVGGEDAVTWPFLKD